MWKSEREGIIFPHLSKNQCANCKDKEPMPMSSYDFSIWSIWLACIGRIYPSKGNDWVLQILLNKFYTLTCSSIILKKEIIKHAFSILLKCYK